MLRSTKSKGSRYTLAQQAHLGEQHDAVDAHRACLPDGVQQAMAPAQAVHARHRRDWQVLLAIVDEHRQDEVVR